MKTKRVTSLKIYCPHCYSKHFRKLELNTYGDINKIIAKVESSYLMRCPYCKKLIRIIIEGA